MSNFKGHILGTILIDIIIIVLLFFITDYFGYNFNEVFNNNYLFVIMLIMISILFSLFPDIDTNSIGRHFFYFIFWIIDLTLIIFRKYQWAAILGFFVMLPSLSKHRGFTHSKITAVIITSPFLLIPMYIHNGFTLIGLPYFIAALIGYLSHLLFDGKLL